MRMSRRRSGGSPRDLASAASAFAASVKNSRAGLPTILALTPAENSSPATNAPESIVGPSGVSHQRFLCMPISSAPLRIRRNARLRLSQVAASGESPTTTAAARASGFDASSSLRRRWPSNSVRASSEVRT